MGGVGWVVGWLGGYDQLCCPASPKLLLGLDLGLGCDKKLEMIDRILLRNILDAHSKTGVEWLYSETGKMPLRFLIQY